MEFATVAFVSESQRQSCKRNRHEVVKEVEDMLSWASSTNLRAGLELYDRLRGFGLLPDADSLTLNPEGAGPTVPHYEAASSLMRESILATIERRRHKRSRTAAPPPEPGERGRPAPLKGTAGSDWAQLPLDVLLQLVADLDARQLHKAACVCSVFKDLIGHIIRSLSFSWCHESGQEINAAVRGAGTIFRRLERIDVSRHAALRDDSLRGLIAANGPHLRAISFAGCNLSDETLDCIAANCPALERLDVSSCTGMTNGAFVRLAKACQGLSSVNLCGCSLLMDTALMALSIHCSNLREVNLGWCCQVTDFGVECLARGCPDLRAVDLCGCVLTGDKAICALAESCKSLSSLGLHCLRRLTDHSMRLVAQELHGLASLNVSGCGSLSFDAVQGVIESNPGLHTCLRRRSVIVSGCMGLVGIQCSCHSPSLWAA
uniref:F-box and leucine-rich repeat protein 1 (S-phase kinase-associated protein 2) n=1 Tax=Tetraselmis sp. GSL018 TaxID=582737 RepID=A0A061SFH4_9CHLO